MFLGYPLHPPGRPETLRDRHLPEVRVPMLFVQGTRDAFARWDLLEAVIARLGATATLHRVDGGGPLLPRAQADRPHRRRRGGGDRRGGARLAGGQGPLTLDSFPMGAASGVTVSLPKDSLFVELQPEILTFETRDCLLPGTQVVVQPGDGRPAAAAAGAGGGMPGRGQGQGRVPLPRARLPGLGVGIGSAAHRAVHPQGTRQRRPAPGPRRQIGGMRTLQGAVVAVTGASSGIGREAALAFAREGARLAVSARRTDRLEEVAEAARAMGGEAWVMAADVADPEQVRRFVLGAVSRFGRLDVLVNNAGYGVRGRVEDTPLEAYRRLMDVNYIGTVAGCQAALPVMRRQRSGVIINVSSIVGHRALPTGGAYAATKAAQISLTEALRAELRGSGVFACSVHPIGTPRSSARWPTASPGPRHWAVPWARSRRRCEVAQAIVRCAKRPRPEVFPYPASRVLVGLNEIAGLKLDADWVILSACNTAAGGAEGAEALSGLARAFFYAGARSLLVSHWADADTCQTARNVDPPIGVQFCPSIA